MGLRPVALSAALSAACGGAASSPSPDPLPRPADETPASETIPFEEIARFPRPGMGVPTGIAFSRRGTVTYLRDPSGGLTYRLFAFDPKTGRSRELAPPPVEVDEDALPPEEKLRRERMRERGRGITRYVYAEKADLMVVPLAGAVYVARNGGPLTRIVEASPSPALDPQPSPDGSQVAFVRNGEIFVVPSSGGTPRQVTFGAAERGVTHGLAEYVAQEEMGRHHGFWWSPDGRRIAFTEVDASPIPPFTIPHFAADRPTQEVQRYPFAGGPNARVRLGVVDLHARGRPRPVWADLSMEGLPRDGEGFQDTYLARVHFLPDGRIAAEVEDRRQQRLDVLEVDPDTGKSRLLWREESDVWIQLHRLFHAIETGPHAGRILWGSERDGFLHLYLLERDGTPVRQLTTGPWVVDALHAVDETRGIAYVSGNREDPRERHLYAVSLADGAIRRLTPEPGTHAVVVDRVGFSAFADTHHAVDRPPVTVLRSLEDGRILGTIHAQKDPRIERLGLGPPELLEIRREGAPTLYAAYYRPEGSGPYPTIVSVYGGPGVQVVRNAYDLTADLRAQALRKRGVAVLKLDNRGSARRGRAFAGAVRWNLGDLEVRDQVAGIEHLRSAGLLAGATAGIYGWSYGGYMAAMSLAKAPSVFDRAVAGAPVTSWDGYDTHYTERYMGLPAENEAGYRKSSVLEAASGIRGRLLLVHGLLDENVHFRHTARLAQRLIDHGIRYETLLFPGERHMPRKIEDRVYMEQAVFDFLLDGR